MNTFRFHIHYPYFAGMFIPWLKLVNFIWMSANLMNASGEKGKLASQIFTGTSSFLNAQNVHRLKADNRRALFTLSARGYIHFVLFN